MWLCGAVVHIVGFVLRDTFKDVLVNAKATELGDIDFEIKYKEVVGHDEVRGVHIHRTHIDRTVAGVLEGRLLGYADGVVERVAVIKLQSQGVDVREGILQDEGVVVLHLTVYTDLLRVAAEGEFLLI